MYVDLFFDWIDRSGLILKIMENLYDMRLREALINGFDGNNSPTTNTCNYS